MSSRGAVARLWLAFGLAALLITTHGVGPGQANLDRGQERGPAPDLSAYPWIYLRDGRPPTGDESWVELVAVGDVMLGRDVAGVTAPLAAVSPWLAAADLAVGNLESAIVAGGTPRSAAAGEPQPIILQAPVSAADELARAGFDLLGLANNHSLDYGLAGLAETVQRLEQARIIPLGAGPAGDGAPPVVRLTVRGVRLALLAFNAVAEPHAAGSGADSPDGMVRSDWDPPVSLAAVAAARARSDAVVVLLHWGYEYEPVADPSQVAAAEALLSAGADLVLGHHPHVVQGTVVANGRLAAYSLGNLVFDQGAGETAQGLALRAFFDRRGLCAVQALPLRAGVRPRLLRLSCSESEVLLARAAPPPSWLAFACRPDGCDPAVAEGEPAQGGLFWSGALDLTGDGVPERVRRAADHVTIYQDGVVAWQSPPEWRVVDAALGDPNDDGRGELLLALWRPDPEGYQRSQPYIVGYRGGDYKVLWGGRPLIYPLHEVELGDVDGDGAQELVVLEEQGALQTVAVWRWQGWSFSQVWRSEPGLYRHLLLPAGDGRAAIWLQVTG